MEEFSKNGSKHKYASMKLRPYQEKAIRITADLVAKKERKILLEVDVGTGRTTLMVALVDQLIKTETIQNVLLLTYSRMSAEQITAAFGKRTTYRTAESPSLINDHNITIYTYSKLRSQIANNKMNIHYDLIICEEAQYIKGQIVQLFETIDTVFVGIISSHISVEKKQHWFSGLAPSFKYSIEDGIEDGYIKYGNKKLSLSTIEYNQLMVSFCSRLLQKFGSQVTTDPIIDTNYKSIRPDLLVTIEEQKVIFEIKTYIDRYTSMSIIESAVLQLIENKNNLQIYGSSTFHYRFCLILFCEIDPTYKKQVFDQYDITIWDIPNILYICGNDAELSKELSNLVYYSLSDIFSSKPYGWVPRQTDEKSVLREPTNQNRVESLVERLNASSPGKEKKAASEYEDICTEIVQFLFGNAFTQNSKQHKTNDELFRMDLLCGIKGTSAFWKLIIEHYNTRFVVFEFKNYSEILPQNLVYITEKYLFNAALRNVAIIVSRKGFSENAKIAALGCLKECGKLIIDITNNDLVEMLHKKADDEEPSDYLFWKLENLLMSVSK